MRRAAGAEAARPRDPEGRDLRPAGPQRRRQDDDDQHRLRHRHPEPAAPSPSTATTSSATIAPRRRKIGLVPQELTTDAFETVWATVSLQPRPVRLPARCPYREGAQGPVALGQAQGEDHGAVRRHEAPGDDRQGAGHEPRDPVPRRADRRRRRRAAARHVGSWSATCATAASPSSSPPIISRRPRRWPTGSG